VADVPPLILVGSELGCDRQLLRQQQVAARPPDKDIVSASGRLRPDVQGGGFFFWPGLDRHENGWVLARIEFAAD